jgi:23S rRNA (adenine2030-N6)-methyltransferase
LNYRHAFHAGGFTDVVKHLILTRIIEYLKLKDAAFRVIDTHAGIGRYDFTGDEAKRSPEWKDGIQRLFNKGLPESAQQLAQPYLDAVRSENKKGNALIAYPGSPLLVRKLLRPQDRLSAIELHPEDAKTLGELFTGDIQVRVIELDGWLALGAHLPPKEKRGLVLVDPPFEEAGEFERLAEGLVKAHKRWPGGTYALWYPLKEPRDVNAFVTALKASEIPKMLRAELTIDSATTPSKLFGTGMIVVNPPYTLADELKVLLPPLTGILSAGPGAKFAIDWISPG